MYGTFDKILNADITRLCLRSIYGELFNKLRVIFGSRNSVSEYVEGKNAAIQVRALNMFLTASLIITASLAVLLGSSDVYAQTNPRIGVEWEFRGGINPEFTKVAALNDNNWSDPASRNDQEVLCSVQAITFNGVDFPLMKMTHDLGGGGTYHLRTLEIVTAPILHDDNVGWASAFLFLKRFVNVINDDAHCQAPPVEAAQLPDTCYVSAQAVVDALNNIQEGYAQTGGNCGANARHNPTQVGFYKTNNVSYANLVDSPNTQVNIELNLEHFGNKAKPIKSLFANQDGAAYKAFSAARDRYSKTSRWDHPQVKGFYMLLAYSINGVVDFELDWASRSADYQAQNAGNQGWMRKNNYDLYLKTPLNLTYRRLSTMGLLPADKDPLAINVVGDAFINAFNAGYCTVKQPGSWFYQGHDERYACKSYTITVPGVVGDLTNTTLANWQSNIVTDNTDPMGISKPIDPNPAAVLNTVVGTQIVVEMRNTRHAINANAGIAWDNTNRVYKFVDAAALSRALSPLQ